MVLNMVGQKRGAKMIYGRGEAAQAILEYIRSHPKVTKGKLEDTFNRNTVWYNIYRKDASLIDKIRIINLSKPKGKKIDAFIVKEENDDIDSINDDYADFLIKEFIDFEKSISEVGTSNKLMYIINEMEHICYNKKIRNETFINFILEKAIDPQYLMVNSLYRTWNCIQILAQHLTRDILEKKDNDTETEQRLLNKIHSTCNAYLEKIVFNKEIILEVRVNALDTIAGIDFEYAFHVAVNLLKVLDTKKPYSYAPWDTQQVTEFTAFNALLGYIISTFARQTEKNWVESRKKLFKLLDVEGDSIKKSEIRHLWEFTILGKKIGSVALHPRNLSH